MEGVPVLVLPLVVVRWVVWVVVGGLTLPGEEVPGLVDTGVDPRLGAQRSQWNCGRKVFLSLESDHWRSVRWVGMVGSLKRPTRD